MFGRGSARRAGRRAGRRAARRVVRRRAFVAAPLARRRPVIRRPLGSLLILGATAGVAYKIGKSQARQIQEYTGYPPEQLSEADLKAAMADLELEPEALDAQDLQEMQGAQNTTPGQSSSPVTAAPAVETPPDYIEELKRLAELKNAGIVSQEEFDNKKKQLLGL